MSARFINRECVVSLFGSMDWILDVIPDLDARKGQFVVDAEEMDDELMEVFCGELRRLMGELLEGLHQNDAAMVATAAHSIKGMGGTIGLPELSVVGMEIEVRAKAANLPDAMPLITALGAWVDRL